MSWKNFMEKRYVGKQIKIINMPYSDDPAPIGSFGKVISTNDDGSLNVELDSGHISVVHVNTDTFDVIENH